MTIEPKFLTLDQVLVLHQMQIELFGGIGGVKDEGLLRSALAQPESGFNGVYFHEELYDMASAYLFHLVKNHAFIDGNKRIAAITAAVFLEVNGLTVIADEKEFEKIVMDAAQSLLTKKQIADFFRKNASIIS
ncbi:MAG: type II toxin-antitoxin system death-on-curing family toxin [Myxococcota bacterium]